MEKRKNKVKKKKFELENRKTCKGWTTRDFSRRLFKNNGQKFSENLAVT